MINITQHMHFIQDDIVNKIINRISLCALTIIILQSIHAADLIIFSYNRPLQLEALLKSTTEYIDNLKDVHVIYRSNTDAFDTAYEELMHDYADVKFLQQLNPPHDFKPILIELLDQTSAEYVCFAVDDNIVTDRFDISACTQALEQTGAYGFYLRLGTNITYSYNYNLPLDLPAFTYITDDICLFSFEGNKSYWAYPNTVDMTVYKKDIILPILKELKFTSPNRLESVWHRIAKLEQNGLCFVHSKMVNTPLNIVQEDWHNKNESSYTPEELLAIWQQGLRIDITSLYKLQNNAAHINYVPQFIKRGIHVSH